MRRPQVPRSRGAKRTSAAAAQSADQGASTSPTQRPAKPVHPANPVRATNPANPVRPATSMKPAKPGRPANLATAATSANPATLVESAASARSKPAAPSRSASAAETKSSGVASRLRGYFSADRAAQTFSSQAKRDTDLSSRRREVRRAKLRAYGRYGLSLLAGLAVVVAAVWGIFFSSFFNLDRNLIIVVNGGDKVSAEQIRQVLDPWVGTPLPRLQLGELAAAVEEIPLVKTASLSREWPNGLSVELQLRTPVFALSAGSVWEVYDAEGVKIAQEAAVPAGTFVAEVSAGEAAERQRAVQLLDRVKGQLDEAVLQEVVTFRSDGNLVELVLKSGAVVKWGDAADGEAKLKVLKVLMSQVPAKVYDVSVPAKPVTA